MLQRLPLVLLIASLPALAQDPPARIGRLSYISGAVSFQPAGVDDWVQATVNRPLTAGDQLYCDAGAHAEIHVPGAAYRLNSNAAFEFLNLDDRNAQVRLSEGGVSLRVRNLKENFEVDTPNLAFTITRPGEYRIDTDPNNYQTYVTVRSGEGQVTANGGSFSVEQGQQAVIGGQNGDQSNIYDAPGYDDFDNWAVSRDRREDHIRSARYVSPNVVGYEDLDDYGEWRSLPGYGECWIPRNVQAGWAPYHDGHWAWVDPWGWSWVDDEPWGFAPFHYGRWAYADGTWGWVPGPVDIVPVYAPALVAWVGFGGGAGVSIGIGGGPAVGWFPLGPRDVYIPAYGASREYVNRVNVTNTTVINTTNVTNEYNNYVQTKTISTVNYVNRNAPGAVAALPQSALANPGSVRPVAVKANQLSAIRSTEPAPRVAPQAASVLGRSVKANVPRPPAAVLSKPIVAKVQPPPRPAPFQQRQEMLARNPGRPLQVQQLRQISQRAAPAPAASRPQVRVVAQAKPIKPAVSHAPAPHPAPTAQNGAARPTAPEPSAPGRPAPVQQRAQQPPPTPAQRGVQAQTGRSQVQPRLAPTPQVPQPKRPYEPPAVQQRQAPTARPNGPNKPPAAQQRQAPAAPSNQAVKPAPRPEQPASEGSRSRTAAPPKAQERSTPPAQPHPATPALERKQTPAPEQRQATPPARKASPPTRQQERAPSPPKRDEQKKEEQKKKEG